MNERKAYIPGKEENKRLMLQNHLLDAFDFSVYEEVMNSIAAPLKILDVGCNSGDMFIPKIKRFPVESYIGIDRSDLQIDKARQLFENDSFHFKSMDVEAADFENSLELLIKGYHIKRFSFINISMVLLHLRDPFRLLNILRHYLEPDGKIIIRDIDDGLNLAYPDDHDWFKRIYKIAEADELTGNRFTGRKVYHYLSQAGYKDIELKRMGFSTDGFNTEEKEVFFDMSYKAILDRTEVMLEKHPDDAVYIENCRWAKEHMDCIRRLFMQDDFMATLGFMTYTAGNK